MTPDVPNVSNAKVTVSDFLSISDGMYVEIIANSFTSQYISKFYPTAQVSSLSDDAIINKLKSEVNLITPDLDLSYYYNISANASYTYCAVARDASGGYGTLTKQVISTKGTSNQPRVALTISKSGNNINISAIKNSYCSSYLIWLGAIRELSDYDIWYARLAYKEGERLSVDIPSFPFEYNSSYPYSCVIALAYNSSGVNSGYVDVKVVRHSDGIVVRSAQVDLRSLGKEAIQQIKSGKIDGKFLKTVLNFDKK
jgi:hypothetical protein